MRKYLISCLIGVSLLLSSNVFAADYFGRKSEHTTYTAGEAIAIGDTVAFSDTTGYVYKADTDTAWRLPVRGLADAAIASGASGVIVRKGILLGQSGLTIGENVYVSATAGGLTQTPVTAYPQILGYADTATSYIIDPQSYPVVDLGAISATTGDFSGAVGVDGNFDVGTTEFTVAAATGNTLCSGTMDIRGATGIDGNFDVGTDEFTIAVATGNTVCSGTMRIVGTTTAAAINASAAVGVDGNFDVGTDEFTVAVATGNTVCSGTMRIAGAATLQSTLAVTGDVTAGGGRVAVYCFENNNVAASQTAQAMNRNPGGTVTGIPMPYAGSIFAVAVLTNDSVTSGSFIADPTVSGSVTGLQGTLNVVDTDQDYAVQAKDSDTFAAGNLLGVKYTTDATFAPDGSADIAVCVTVEY